MTPAAIVDRWEADVLIRCRNSAAHIARVIRSVLGQADVEARVLIVDDASTDGTVNRVRSIDDARVTLIESPCLLGEGGCLNVGLDRARSRYVVVAPDDGVLLPGALKRLLAPLERSRRTGQAYGGAFSVDGDGRVVRAKVRATARLHAERTSRYGAVGYMLAFGHEALGPVAYRRVALDAVDRFDAQLAEGACLDATVRIARSHDVEAVPELLCARWRDGSQPPAPRRWFARQAWSVATPTRRRPGAVTAWLRVLWALGCERVLGWAGTARAIATSLVWKVGVPLAERLYDCALSHLSAWPIGLRRARSGGRAPKRIAYFMWRYPVLSETFIQRELTALEGSGVDVHVIAEGAGQAPGVEHGHLPTVQRTEYLHSTRAGRVLWDLAASWLRRPLRTANLLAYVVFRAYRRPKSIAEDARLFVRAVRLANVLRARRIAHVHSPWGDVNAFIAIVAARLAGTGFSLQFRAHDVHRRTAAFLLSEKMRNASFVVTNSAFNEQRLRSHAFPADRHKIHRIYNGLDLDCFDSVPRSRERLVEARILSVARLIEPKGLVYLLAACRALRESGYRFRCDIIGAPELPLYVNDYIDIMSQYDRLDLGDCVEFMGMQPFSRVLECYRRADIFVLPCVVARDGSNDITPNALLEAMAMRLPVVSTGITAIPEIIEDGISGILVPPNDAWALRDQIARLIDDPELRCLLGENARKRIEERFDMRKNVLSYVQLFGAS
jgi:colanic acid/amylovoran biosynthesis glycosyltransferase